MIFSRSGVTSQEEKQSNKQTKKKKKEENPGMCHQPLKGNIFIIFL